MAVAVLLRLILLAMVGRAEENITTTSPPSPAAPSPTVVAVETATPTMVPSPFCNESVCLRNDLPDVDCCGLRDWGAACEEGFTYLRLDQCGVASGGVEILYRTCCVVNLNDGSSDKDGLTAAEELAITLVFTLTSAVILLFCLRGTYKFVAGGCKYPDFGAVGATVYYDERRGQCFGLIALFTLFNFLTLIFAWLAAGTDPEMLDAFGIARVQTTSSETYLVVGIAGYAVFADETDDKGEYFDFDDDYGKDNDVGNRKDFDWTGECSTAGEQAESMLVVILLLKFVCTFLIYRRQNPNTDTATMKLLAAFLELWCGLLLVGMIFDFSLRCISELPTQKIFLPEEDAEYSYSGDETGTEYNVAFVAPYTSFLFIVLSSIFSLYVGWVHWRLPTWGAELDDKDYY